MSEAFITYLFEKSELKLAIEAKYKFYKLKTFNRVFVKNKSRIG